MRSRMIVLFALAAACTGEPVGDPCTPEDVPQGGFDPAETYVENGSSDCVTRVCLVRGLSGDPRPECMSGCPGEEEIAAHVYCTCRCDEGGDTPPCVCPSGYHCEDTGRLGSYCARD